MKAWGKRHPLLGFAAAVVGTFLLVSGAWSLLTPAPQERVITVQAQRYFYTPHAIGVNRGDHVTLRLVSVDVHHGLYLDGYDLETNARPGQDGTLRFVASRTGRFSFRCSMTCGSFHPYMIGYLKVNPDYRLLGSLWLLGGLFGLVAVTLRRNGRPAAPPAGGEVKP